MLTQIRDDLWETSSYSPLPGLTTHAYVWTSSPSGGNVLFYSTGGGDDFDAIEQLGGAADQYLSHQDEAGPALRQFAQRFGNRLRAPAAEEHEIRRFAEPDVRFADRHIDDNGIEVIPTPGHTRGSTCFVVTGVDGLTYLFTGDTVFLSAEGVWTAGFVTGMSDAEDLTASLEVLAALEPDVVISSACPGERGAHLLGDTHWASCAKQAINTLPADR